MTAPDLHAARGGGPVVRALVVDDEPLPRERIVTLATAHDGMRVIGECSSGMEAVHAIRTMRPDLVFLDVQMPELDGFQVITTLAEDDRDVMPAVIFVTAYDEYAIRAFDVQAVDYLLKPVTPERFAQGLRRALDRMRERPGGGHDQRLFDFVEQLQRERAYLVRFVVRRGNRSAFVPVSDVDWMDVVSNYVRLHAGGKPHLIRETLRSVEEQLDPRRFVRVHRSIIINIERVREIESHAHGEYRIIMADGVRLNTSRTHSDRLRQLLK